MRMSRRLTLAVGPALLLAACSSSGTPVAHDPETAPATTAAATAAASTTTTAAATSTASPSAASSPSASASSGCGAAAVSAAAAALTTYSAVGDISVDGGCHQLSIDTSLPSSDPLTANSTTAVAICNAAAKVGYVGGVSSITVSWTDGHEAAAAIQGMDCIPG